MESVQKNNEVDKEAETLEKEFRDKVDAQVEEIIKNLTEDEINETIIKMVVFYFDIGVKTGTEAMYELMTGDKKGLFNNN